jgi:hexosaminidase
MRAKIGYRGRPTKARACGLSLGTRFAALAFQCLAMAGLVTAAPAPDRWALLPQPAHLEPAGAHALRIASGAAIAVEGAKRRQVRSIADRFARLVANTRGLKLRVASQADSRPDIIFAVDPQANVAGDGGYRIAVDAHGIRITARTPRGAFYGSVTLWQLLTPPGWVSGTAAEIPEGVIEDAPRFPWRALLLDSGRHFQSVADIEQLIDWMSLAKLNVLVWHLTEDQGWRLEIPTYPNLTKIGACRRAAGLDAELTGSPDKPYCAGSCVTPARASSPSCRNSISPGIRRRPWPLIRGLARPASAPPSGPIGESAPGC